MDVSKYNFDADGEWLKIEVKSERELELFEFKVQPLLEVGLVIASKSPDEITAAFIEVVVDWNLTDGPDIAIPCDEENKRKYLPRFSTYLVKAVNGEAQKGPKTLAAVIVDFASNPDSFLKN